MSKKDDKLKNLATQATELMLEELVRRLKTDPESLTAAEMTVIRSMAKDLNIQAVAGAHEQVDAFTQALGQFELPDVFSSIPDEFKAESEKQH